MEGGDVARQVEHEGRGGARGAVVVDAADDGRVLSHAAREGDGVRVRGCGVVVQLAVSPWVGVVSY